MQMEVNTLDYTIGGVLLIECEYRKWRPVVFLSKSLNETERNYKIHDKDILTIIRGLENTEIEQKISKMDIVSVEIQFYLKNDDSNQTLIKDHWVEVKVLRREE